MITFLFQETFILVFIIITIFPVLDKINSLDIIFDSIHNIINIVIIMSCRKINIFLTKETNYIYFIKHIEYIIMHIFVANS